MVVEVILEVAMLVDILVRVVGNSLALPVCFQQSWPVSVAWPLPQR